MYRIKFYLLAYLPMLLVSIKSLSQCAPTVSPSGIVVSCSNVSLTATVGTTVTYQWLNGSTPILGATNATYQATTSGNYRVAVATATCNDTSLATAFTLLPAPSTATSPTGPVAICPGSSVTICANSTAGLSYQWFINNIAIIGTTNSCYTATNPGSYTVAVTYGPGCSAMSAPIVVTFYALPPAATTPTGTVNICQGSSVTICPTATAGATYQWYQNNVTIPGGINLCYVAVTAGTYTVKVTSSSTTCSSISAPINVVVNPLPVASISPSGPISACSGSVPMLCGPSSSGFAYQWRCNSVPITGATSLCYTPTGPCNYTLAVVNQYGCQATSNIVAVTVTQTPTAPIVVSPVNLCQHQLAGSLVAVGNNLLWYTSPTGGTGSPTAPIPSSNIPGSTTWYVSRTVNDCESPRAAITVNILPVPNATITTTDTTTFCLGDSAILHSSSDTGITYEWQLNNSPVVGATDSVYTATASGSYIVRMTQNGCINISNVAMVITVNTPPATPVLSSNSPVCAFDIILLTTTSANVYYLWSGPNGFSDIQQNPVLPNAYFFMDGSYSLVVTDSNGCADSASTVVNIIDCPLAVKTNITEKAFSQVLPNPSGNECWLEIYLPKPTSLNIRIIDMTGKTLWRQKLAAKAGEQSVSLPAASIAPGIYIIEMNGNDGFSQKMKWIRN